MAKQPVNLLERHVEKAVLGIATAVLMAAVAMFLVSTPNKIELENERIGPDTIDQRILEASTQLREKLRRAPVPPIEVNDHVPELEKASSPLAYAGVSEQLPSPVQFLPRVPRFKDEAPAPGEIRLADVIAPIQPKATFGRATLDLQPPLSIKKGSEEPDLRVPPPGRGPFQQDVNWVTVAALFDQQEQIDVCKSAGYRLTRRNPYLTGVDLQRRMKLEDGSYTEWQDIETYRPRTLEEIPKVEIIQARGGPGVSQDMRDQVREFFQLLKFAQSELMRPLFPSVKFGEGWQYPEYSDIDVRELDAELCTPNSKRNCGPRPYSYEPVKEQPAQTLGPRDRIRKLLDEAQKMLEQMRCEEARTRLNDVLNDSQVRANETREAQSKMRDVDQCVRDRERASGGRDSDDDEEDAPDEIRRSPFQVVWAHDATLPANGGAVSGRVYQYRIRARLYNRYCAVVEDLAENEDAAAVEVVGKWSAPTEDVYIAPDTEMFLTSGDPFREAGAKVTVFKWFEGVWVKHAFPVQVGAEIGGIEREPVRVTTGGDVDRPEIDFTTRSTVLDLDYDYSYRPKKDGSKGSFRIAPAQRTIVMVRADESGGLFQHVLLADKTGDAFKRYRELVFEPDMTSRR